MEGLERNWGINIDILSATYITNFKTPMINISTARHEDKIVLSVQDNGRGIAKKNG